MIEVRAVPYKPEEVPKGSVIGFSAEKKEGSEIFARSSVLFALGSHAATHKKTKNRPPCWVCRGRRHSSGSTSETPRDWRRPSPAEVGAHVAYPDTPGEPQREGRRASESRRHRRRSLAVAMGSADPICEFLTLGVNLSNKGTPTT